jgi:hypothetical protein
MASKTKFHVLLLATFGLGLLLAFSSWNWLTAPLGVDWSHRFNEVVHKIGDALLIAPILALAVDQAAKRELLKEFAKDVSSHIIGRQLPEAMREYIRAYLDVEFLRSDWQVTYEISPWTNKDGSIADGYVQLATKSLYTMVNLTTEARVYNFQYEVEDSWFSQVGETRITHVSGRPANQRADFDLPEEQVQLAIERTHVGRLFTRRVTIPARAKWEFVAESVECFRDSSTCQPFSAFYAVEKTEVVVTYPKSTFTVNLTLTFDDVTDATNSPIELTNGTAWRLRKPILPGQGFVVTWRRKPAVAAKAPTPVLVRT